MSLISIEQFKEFAEDYPELAQCYDLSNISRECVGAVGGEDAVDNDVAWAFGCNIGWGH